MISTKLDLIQMIGNAGLVVQFVLLLLLFFSVTTWAIILLKYLYFKKAFKESTLFIDFFWKSRDLSDAFAKAKELKNSPIARTFRIGYSELKNFSRISASAASVPADSDGSSLGAQLGGMGNVQRSLRRAMDVELNRMTQLVPFLATTGSSTPFIGLFGTVWGIMKSFHGIGLRGTASLAVVAPGISEALVATAAGLAAAIPAVIAFNFFTQKIRTMNTELQSFSSDLLNIIERDILRPKGNTP
jgi:biopolymer transport protein TolQ